MKKVLFLISSLHIGGAQKSLVLLANALARRGYDITIRILVNKTDLQSELDERIKVEYKPYKMHLGKKIPYIRHEFYDTGLWENRTAAKNLYRYYVGDDKFDVEIAFSAGIVQKTIEGSTNSDAVHIAWVHSDYAGEGGFRANLNARQLFDSFSLLDYVVCVTKNAAESYKKAVGDTGNVVTINNIIPVDDIRKKAEEKPAIQVKKAGFHMVVVSRIEDKTKGIFRIVEVVSRLKSEGCDVSLAIVGKGIDDNRLRQLVEEKNAGGYITLTGVQINPYPYIKEADLLVCPSYYEAYCLAVAEAIVLGVPVVSTKCIGTTELLENGIYGMLVENTDSGLYYGIKEFMTTPGLLDSYSKREKEKTFDQEIICQQVISLFEKRNAGEVTGVVKQNNKEAGFGASAPEAAEFSANSSPRLSVVVTVYNIAEHLPRFFECMQKQTFTDYQLLIFDDGSSDNSLDICKRYAEKDGRIKLFEFEHEGISATRDKAMEYIDTPLTAYADGDDYFEPEYLQHLIEGYEKHGADLVISGVNYHAGEDLHRTDRHKSWGNRLITRERFDEELPRLLWDRHLNYLYSKLFKSELLKPLRVGKNVNQGSDTMFVIQYLKNADSIEMVDHADYHYVRYKSRSVTSTKGIDSFNRLIRLNRYLQEYCIENGMMTELMQHMIDGRILLLTKSLTNQAVYMELPKEERIRMIDHMLTNGHYLEAYNRQKERNTLNYDGFTPDKPMSGEEYFNHWASERERMKRKAKILDKTPNVIKNIYRKLK